jgi:hypothetical protein
MLASSGFEMHVADTPEKLAHVKTLVQRRLIARKEGDKVHYVYADAEGKCLYVGTGEAYQRYKKLAAQQTREQQSLEEAQDVELDTMNWGVFEPIHGRR